MCHLGRAWREKYRGTEETGEAAHDVPLIFNTRMLKMSDGKVLEM